MSRFLSVATLAVLFVPASALAFISCTTWGSTITCDDHSLPDVKPSAPIQVPDNTSGLDTLKAQYGTSDVYACMRDTDYLSHSGSPSSGVYFQLLKSCVERKAIYGGTDVQLQKIQMSATCPPGTYSQNGVCIQTIVQQQAQALVQQDNGQICRNDYGAYSTWTGQTNENGGPVCGCLPGYDWEGDVCVAVVHAEPATCAVGTTFDGVSCIKNETRCRNDYGPGSTWDGSLNESGGPQCSCSNGYAWSETQNLCVAAEVRVIPQVEQPVPEEPKSKGWFASLLDWLFPW